MKKILYIFLILCCFSLVGGICLFTGCSSSNSDNNTQISTPSEETEAPSEDGGSEDDENPSDNEEDEEISANLQNTDYTFKVYAQIKDNADSYTTTRANTTSPSQIFELQWRSSESALEPINADAYKMNSGGELSSDGTTVYASYYYCNSYDNTWFTYYKRYVKLLSNSSSYAVVGISTTETYNNNTFRTCLLLWCRWWLYTKDEL